MAWSNDIHVFDSFNDDWTLEVAAGHGATISQRKSDGYATHRNASLKSPAFEHAWVLILDADERVPDSYAREM